MVFADLIAQFPGAVRAPGAALYRAGVVKILHSSGHAVLAEVGRGPIEQTAIEVLGGDLTLACTCAAVPGDRHLRAPVGHGAGGQR